MNKEDFLNMVQAELDTIKAKATPEEIAKLDFSKFNHNNNCECIYGQLTGICTSSRAEEIMPKTFFALTNFSPMPNGDYVPFNHHDFREGYEVTALEKYLFMVKAGTHKRIIKYLKGEQQTITLR